MKKNRIEQKFEKIIKKLDLVIYLMIFLNVLIVVFHFI